MSDARAHTVRLELTDEPGELLNALRPIADNGGNLLSIYHERGNLTPRGRIPVEVDLECAPERFSGIVEALREAGINVIQAGEERYAEAVSVILVGPLIETDLSDTLRWFEECANLSVLDFSLSAPEDDRPSARLRLAAEAGGVADALSRVRDLAAKKELLVIEPQLDRGAEA
ncbi:threonine dehydratase [Halalkalicoccus paucihalophilus]|uniref:Threonine dehydratase n=1 Tax=Halalkalicoccus paucihalophilus TaxID=1008153 RepID=A0A151AK85_9EURY|nr:amino acid-binding protein [Halalkalicoccus paucihalophilus]KYH27940.1 threonine dehydratase [Halalkalicoccus paucihalophilus]